jgi:hypothetical protein
MSSTIRAVAFATISLAVTACATSSYDSGTSSSSLREASSIAETACLSAVNAQYGGKVNSVKVASSEYSEANSIVMVDAVGVRGSSSTEHWRCLVSNDGKVQDLSVSQ